MTGLGSFTGLRLGLRTNIEITDASEGGRARSVLRTNCAPIRLSLFVLGERWGERVYVRIVDDPLRDVACKGQLRRWLCVDGSLLDREGIRLRRTLTEVELIAYHLCSLVTYPGCPISSRSHLLLPALAFALTALTALSLALFALRDALVFHLLLPPSAGFGCAGGGGRAVKLGSRQLSAALIALLVDEGPIQGKVEGALLHAAQLCGTAKDSEQTREEGGPRCNAA